MFNFFSVFHPSTESGARSVVVMTQPYDGISWTGDPVDTLFSSAKPGADGFYPGITQVGA